MASHQDSSPESASLCDRLFERLKQELPSVAREKGDNWCGFRGGDKVFAYAWHSTSDSWVKIWFRGSSGAASGFPKLSIRPRNPTSGTWKKFGGSFKIYDDAQVEEAAGLLSSISYPLRLTR